MATTRNKTAASQPTAPKPTAANKVGSAARKPLARSLHLGLNSVSPKAYGGWSGDLVACEFDAHDMTALAKGRGMKPTTLITKAATRAKFLAAMRSAAKALKAGDLFFLSFSGHGGQVPDITGEETDKQDETWCLFDGQLIDDELYLELGRFAAGVRILVLSDSCHSGTVTRAAPGAATAPGARPRMMPPAVARRTYLAHQAFYDKLQKDVAKASKTVASADPDAVLASLPSASTRLTEIAGALNPAVVLISGCQDNQTSSDGDHNGLFTEHLLQAWQGGLFKGDYRRLHALIRAGMPGYQSPRLYVLGKASAFLKQTPFSV
ncbi:MAG: caspase family protein [Burkholderiales bacterium]